MRLRRWLGVVAVAMATACGGSAGPTQVVVTNTVQVTVSDGPDAGRPPATINMSDKRIHVAFEAVNKLLGHSVQFEIDNSLIPKFESELHEAFIQALETLVTSLEYANKHYSEATTFAGPHLGTIAWTYSPSKGEISTKLDVEKNRLDVPVPGDEWGLLPDSMIVTVFDQAWDTEKERRYTALAPEAVPVAEHKYYYDFLRSYHRPPPGDTEVDKEKRAIQILNRQVALYPLVKDEEVREDLRQSLVHGGTNLRDWYADLQKMPELAKPLAPAQAAWVKWLNASFSELRDTEQRDIGRVLFSYSYKASPGFPVGLDVVKLGTPRIRSWLARSQEKNRNGIDAEDGANSMIVCPFEFSEDTYRFSPEYQSCNGIVYTSLVAKGYQPLIQLLRTEKAPALTQTATLNVLDKLGSEVAVGLIDALWNEPEHVRAALVALAGYTGWGSNSRRRDGLPELLPQPLLKRIPGWWRAHPEFHGELLYLTVTLGDEYEGTVVWPKLTEFLGSRLTASDVAGFLRQTPRTIWYLRLLVHALSDGWSRSKMVIPELERFLDDATRSRRGEPQPYHVAERCVQFLCITGNGQDIRALQKYLKDRIERFPSEERSLASFADDSSEQCPAAKAAAAQEAKTSKPGVTFGD
jgi:hypothetical protein